MRETKRKRIGILVPLAFAAAVGVGAKEGASAAPAPAPAQPAASATAAAATPHLEVESFTINLGEIKRGDNAEAVFVLRNKGDAVLKVLSAKPT